MSLADDGTRIRERADARQRGEAAELLTAYLERANTQARLAALAEGAAT